MLIIKTPITAVRIEFIYTDRQRSNRPLASIFVFGHAAASFSFIFYTIKIALRSLKSHLIFYQPNRRWSGHQETLIIPNSNDI
jgi:hypothetical protein